MTRFPAPPPSRRLRWYRASHGFLTRSYGALLTAHAAVRAVVSGAWLGLLDDEDLHAVGDAFYAGHERYADDAYNLSGLWDWEAALADRHLAGRERVLLVGAGAGREVVALARRGHAVRAFECNGELVARAQRYLNGSDLRASVAYAPPDTCPDTGGTFDALVVGWGAYMLVRGRERRVALLRSMRAQAAPGAPLLLSFFVRAPGARRFVLIRGVADPVRRLRGRPPVELGDDLEPEFVHYFDRAEIAAELASAGFELRTFAAEPYGHAVGVAV